eukprot:GFYU01003401.1.p1 GENE.GFYU01003401.1~~GFYU01003401.1.p1  ORF type:complete len:920 (-),score=282.91 GFYU01003401.1:122-2881(-)
MKTILLLLVATTFVAAAYANLSGDGASDLLNGAAITAPPPANAGDAHGRAFEVHGPAYKLWGGRLHMPVVDKLEGHANDLLDRVDSLERRGDGYDVAWEEQAALNHGFEREMEDLEEQFDRIKSFRVSSHHVHAFEGQDPKHLQVDVTLDIEPTSPVKLNVEGTALVAVMNSEYTWSGGDHSNVATFVFDVTLRGPLSVQTVEGVFESDDPVFKDQKFAVHVAVTPPCTVGNGGCEHVCVEADKDHSCLCNAGYRLDEDEHSCHDVDECTEAEDSEDIHNCDLNSVCTNLIGSFSCDCNDGYRGNGHALNGEPGCYDIDECEENIDQCPQHSQCINTDGFYECPCLGGFRHADSSDRHSACDDIDECAESTHVCDANAECTNVSPFYTCECNVGYRGSGETCHSYYEDILGDSSLGGLFTFDNLQNCLYVDFVRSQLGKAACSTLLNADMFMPGFSDAFAVFSFNGGHIQQSQAYMGQPLQCLTLVQDFFTGNYVAGAMPCDDVPADNVEGNAHYGTLSFKTSGGEWRSVSHASPSTIGGLWLGDHADGSDPNYSYLVVSKQEIEMSVFGFVITQFIAPVPPPPEEPLTIWFESRRTPGKVTTTNEDEWNAQWDTLTEVSKDGAVENGACKRPMYSTDEFTHRHACQSTAKDNFGYIVTVNMYVGEQTRRTFRISVDANQGYYTTFDGTTVHSDFTAGIWYRDNWAVTDAQDMAPGTHTLKVHVFENCCDGWAGIHYSDDDGQSWHPFAPPPPTYLSMEIESRRTPGHMKVNSASEWKDVWETLTPVSTEGIVENGVCRKPIYSTYRQTHQGMCGGGANNNLAFVITLNMFVDVPTSRKFRFSVDANQGYFSDLNGEVINEVYHSVWDRDNYRYTDAYELTKGAHVLKVHVFENCCDGWMDIAKSDDNGATWQNFSVHQ